MASRLRSQLTMRAYELCISNLIATSCILSTIIIILSPTEVHAIESGISEYTKEHRQKRTVVTLGAKILSKLLKNAEHLYTNGYDSLFIKSGGVTQAEKDFYTWVKPAKAKKTKKKDKKGKVGNIILTLRSDSKQLTLTKVPIHGSSPRTDPPLHNIILYRD